MKKFAKVLKWIGIIIISILIVITLLFFSVRCYQTWKYRISSDNGIQEETYVTLNGTEQFISIRGEDISNPVIIFLHGGPASPSSTTAHLFQQDLEDEYTMVHWDQRGSGRSYINDANFSADELSTELLIKDLDELVNYIQEEFNQEKVILMGHSWGTILGTEYILQHPEKVSEYIGIGTMVNGLEGYGISATQALAIAKAEGNIEDVTSLEQLIKLNEDPANMDMDTFMQLSLLCMKYLTLEDELDILEMLKMTLFSPYLSFDDIKWQLTSFDFELYFGIIEPLYNYSMFDYDANTHGYNFEIPVYYIQGDSDFRTPTILVEEYFDKIKAPDKELIVMPNAGHNFYLDYPEEFCDIVKSVLQ